MKENVRESTSKDIYLYQKLLLTPIKSYMMYYFCGDRGSNYIPYIYHALFLSNQMS